MNLETLGQATGGGSLQKKAQVEEGSATLVGEPATVMASEKLARLRARYGYWHGNGQPRPSCSGACGHCDGGSCHVA